MWWLVDSGASIHLINEKTLQEVRVVSQTEHAGVNCVTATGQPLDRGVRGRQLHEHLLCREANGRRVEDSRVWDEASYPAKATSAEAPMTPPRTSSRTSTTPRTPETACKASSPVAAVEIESHASWQYQDMD